MQGRPLVFNQDCADLLNGAPVGSVQAHIREYLRRVFAAGVPVFVADVAFPDVVIVNDLPTGERLGARFEEPPLRAELDPATIPRYEQIRELAAERTDVLRLAVEEGHQAGALVLGAMRMSDAHYGTRFDDAMARANQLPYGPFLSQFIIDHPEWCNTWQSGRLRALYQYEPGTLDATLNYSVPQVRQHRLQILREMATNYNIDGLELNWMRFARHFPAGQQAEYADDLTAFVSQVREMLDEVARQRGAERPVLGHRVAASVQECPNIGCDVARWAREGYADFIAPMDFLETDPNLPTEDFITATEGTECRVHPGPQRWLDFADDRSQMILVDTLDKFRALAHNYYAWGADGASTFNIYNWRAEKQEFYAEALAVLSDPRLAAAGPRHYMYGPVCRLYTDGPRYQMLEFPAGAIGKRQVYRFRMADGRNGEPVEGVLRFRIYDATAADEFAVDVNGQPIPAEKMQIVHQPDGEKLDERFTWRPGLRFEIPLPGCPPFRGDNELGVTLVKRSVASETDPSVQIVEVLVAG